MSRRGSHLGRATGRSRRGAALVVALALLALAAALLAGAFSAADSMSRATRSVRESARADAAARRLLADLMAEQASMLRSLPVGATVDRSVPTAGDGEGDGDGDGIPLRARLQLHHIADDLYVASADVRVGRAGVAPVAHRRYRLLLERRTGTDSASPPTIAPLGRWGLAAQY